MARDFQISGETLVLVKGRPDGPVPALFQLGLSTDPIHVSLEFRHKDLIVDAQGDEIPVDVQYKLAAANISMRLIHFDPIVVQGCWRSANAGAVVVGTTGRAGQRMGNNQPRFGPGGANGNHYLGLNLTSPVGNIPYRFWYAYLTQRPSEYTLGTEKTILTMNWRAIPFTQDPYGGSPSQPLTTFGTGAYGNIIWDNTLDT